jgi:hypothetical protein
MRKMIDISRRSHKDERESETGEGRKREELGRRMKRTERERWKRRGIVDGWLIVVEKETEREREMREEESERFLAWKAMKRK